MPKLVLPPQYSRRILYASSLTLCSIYSAACNERSINLRLACSVLATSVLYWYHPVLGWRRNLDMLCTFGSLGYQAVYTSFETTERCRYAYWFTLLCGGSCYATGRYISKVYGNLNVSSMLHVGLHMWGNIGNCILYDSFKVNALGLGPTSPSLD